MSSSCLKNNRKILLFNVFNQSVQDFIKFFIWGRFQTCQKILSSHYIKGPGWSHQGLQGIGG